MSPNNPDRKYKGFLVWPRQIGKDTSCFAFMSSMAWAEAGNYFYIFPTKEMARKALWEKVTEDGRKLLAFLPLNAKGVKVRNQDMSLELPNGSVIRLIGLDKDPDAVRGITPMGVVYSEFAYSDPEAYNALLPAFRRKGCWQILNSTPNGDNHFKRMFDGVKDDPEWFVSFYQAIYPDKENFIHIHEPEYYENLVKTTTMEWDDVEREYGCNFATSIKGAIFGEHIELAREEKRIGNYVYDNTKPVHTYWDLGVNDPTAIWFMQENGNAYIFIDYYEDNRKSTNDLTKILSDKGYSYGTHFLPHDAGQSFQGEEISTTANSLAQSLQNFRVEGTVEVVNRHPKQYSIDMARREFNRYYFADTDNVNDGLKKLERYHRKYDKKKQCFTKEPVHDYTSHCADAFMLKGVTGIPLNDPFELINDVDFITDYTVFD